MFKAKFKEYQFGLKLGIWFPYYLLDYPTDYSKYLSWILLGKLFIYAGWEKI
jgi:hypothetical protein